jgi:Raf kinase inhibitor-like YbhB/YbcL family protein
MRTYVMLAAILPAAISVAALAQQGDGTKIGISTHVNKPQKVEATPARIAQLRVPEGFAIAPFATQLKNIRIIAVAPNGNIYISRREQGDVILLKDENGDGKADAAPVVVANRAGAHGLAIKDDKLYLVTVKELFVADIRADGKLGPLNMLLGDLADGGQHPNRTIAFGPDGMLYISVGSTCNACNETNQEAATVLRASPDGKSRVIFASGLRNTIGFAWHPKTGELWGADHGIDHLGDDIQPEELNKLEQGKKYGWPHIWGAGDINPQSTPPGEITKEQWKATSVPMTLGYTAHAAPMQLVFYTGRAFPAQYQGDAFVTMRGSWNREPPSGYEIVRIRFQDGQPKSIEPFVTGFLTDSGKTHIARPVGLARAKDGSLLMADDANGVLYRISATGKGASANASPPPADTMVAQAKQGIGVPLVKEREETAGAKATIKIASPTIKNNGAIPSKHSEYYEGVSPELEWTKVDGAKSYVLIMEDPDAKPITPFVHWVAWNIPANVTSLPEGLQEQPRLTEPEGLLQGRTSRGSVGYFGPRPPVGDPPHRYHFQIFALDTNLDVPAGAERDQVLAAMKGHVIAEGSFLGTYQQKTKPLK